MSVGKHGLPGCKWLRLALVVACLFVLAGCGLNRQLARQADRVVAAEQPQQITCPQADHCAIGSPFHQLAKQARLASTPQQPIHYVNVLEQGEDSLLLRVHLIRAARKTIDIQTFIWDNDDAGRLILDELLTAARRGVRVRVIADQLFSLEDTELLSRLALVHRNFEVRIYNPTFHKAVTQPLEFAASIVCCFTRFNQRMHNKLFLVDNEFGIAGGRNYENRYFDWDHEFDYRDRDVLVTGDEAGREMATSFEKFWSNKRAARLTRLNDVNQRLVAEADQHLPLPAAERGIDPMRVEILRAHAGLVAEIERRFISTALRVGQVDYFSDTPAKQEQGSDPNKQLGEHIASMISQAQTQIIMQTPYLVISKHARRVFRKLQERETPPDIIVSTNSLAATDAFYVYALSHKYKKRYLKLGFRIYEFKPFPGDASKMISRYSELSGDGNTNGYQRFGKAPLTSRGVRIGMHAKSIVIDGRTTLIGSHNFDPRSDNYNTESGLIIHDRAVADLVRSAIVGDAQPQNSWTIAKRPRTNLLHRINNAIADFSTVLPLFDFWPFRYATSYELNPGCAPLKQNDPHFYDCYTAVGDFPEVDLPMKTIYTRIVTAFGAGAVGIL
ncbi:MAG TPA: phospholipase D family protein [Dokdonella sp.]|uniref:phospholipase D family protein n=1 Tax=Dokdonella sp. TaxID=2291710 RepID=UPI002D80E5DA|nr:phospholipase D family protein [Dokdonella sp.]HET9032509.1 phospholipase D family protein [Dokdonella sp.]